MCWEFAERVQSRDYFMRSQFLRAALSIKLNIAEGASEWRRLEKARFYRIARRSAGEHAAILDDLPRTLNIPEHELEPLYNELIKISNTLRQLVLSMERKARAPRRKRAR